MFSAGFEPTIPVRGRPQTHALGRAVTLVFANYFSVKLMGMDSLKFADATLRKDAELRRSEKVL